MLARKKGEVVKIGQDITVTVVDIRGDVIRLGIEAPRSMAVHRLEVFAEIERENRQASATHQSLQGLAAFRPKQ